MKAKERPGKNTFKSLIKKGNDIGVHKKSWKNFTLSKSIKDNKLQQW
jgi:hypothetical protein